MRLEQHEQGWDGAGRGGWQWAAEGQEVIVRAVALTPSEMGAIGRF